MIFFYIIAKLNYVIPYYFRSKLSLPHPTSVRNWTSSTDAEPGFLTDVFTELRKLPLDDRDCNLVLDSMSIRKQIIWDVKNNKYVGFCDYGNELRLEGSEATASEVLVFMLVALKGKWKWPIGYFFVNKVNATIQAQLVRTALTLASGAGVRVWSVTCDGTATNYETLRQLGCDLFKSNYRDIKPFFKHPTEDCNVWFVPDACHNLKLARNALGTYGSFVSPSGKIMWCYFQHLVNIQDQLSLKIANKLGHKHIEWKKNIMNVKLAAQTFSASVANAIEFLSDCGVDEFEDSKETVVFTRVMDRILDFLNSRSPFGRGFKAPLTVSNMGYLEKIMIENINYLFQLRDLSGTLLCHSGRKTFLIGLAVSVKSVFDVAKQLLRAPTSVFKYMLLYKFSQDHLEIFFSVVRQRSGCNNNPNVLQFVCAMKQILQKNSITCSPFANCQAFNSDSVGSVFELRWNRRCSPLLSAESYANATQSKQYLDLCTTTVENVMSPKLTEVKDNILFYMCGYVVRKLLCSIACSNCGSMLLEEETDHSYCHKHSYSVLTDNNNNGGLLHASASVFKVVSATEKEFQLVKTLRNGSIPFLNKIIAHNVTSKFALDVKVFPNSTNCPDVEIGFDVPHKLQLIRAVSERYLKIRLLSFGKI